MENNCNIEILEENLREHSTYLSQDSLEGRGAGYRGEELAVNYIAQEFIRHGLLPANTLPAHDPESYKQPFSFYNTIAGIDMERRTSHNVIGIWQGTEFPEEYIVLGAHHDGQGMRGQTDLGRDLEGVVTDPDLAALDSIWNSAVDNAVSIASILEIARVLNESDLRMKRSIVFATFGAEEVALNGSIEFVNAPPIPLSSIKAMINLEKIVGDQDAEFLYVSYDTHPIFEHTRKEMGPVCDISLVPFYPGIIADTDHYAFTQCKIPAVTIGTGSEINIHSSLDHADLLNYQLLASRSTYIMEYIVRIANSSSDFQFQGDLHGMYGVMGIPSAIAESVDKPKTIPAYLVTAVINEAKGFKAGIRIGDLIIGVNNGPIPQKSFYQGIEDLLGNDSVHKKNTLEIARGKQILKIEIDQ